MCSSDTKGKGGRYKDRQTTGDKDRQTDRNRDRKRERKSEGEKERREIILGYF